MSSRMSLMLKVAITVLGVAIAIVGVAVVREVLAGAGNSVPKSELERAVYTAEEAVRANPEDPASRVKLAAAYIEIGNAAGGAEQASIAVRLAPKDPSGYYVLGMAQTRQGKTAEAIKNLKKAVDTKGQVAQFYQDAYVALSRAYEKAGDGKLAAQSMTRAVNFGPENVLLLFERGQLYERDKKWIDAMDDYAAALDYVPNYEPAQQGLDRLKKAHPEEYKKLLKQYETTPTPAAQKSGK